MRVGEKDSLILLNTNLQVFRVIPKDITCVEIEKLLTHVRKHYKYELDKTEEVLNDLFFGLKIDQTIGCWISEDDWDRYRQITINGKKVVAHRESYKIFIGEIKLPQVCHHCDRPGCSNPWHLFNGSHVNNREDARLKGRLKKKKELTKVEQYLLWKHINTSEVRVQESEIEITERAKDADKLFGKMK